MKLKNKKKGSKDIENATTLSGFSIYKDEHNRLIYFNRFNKCGYVLDGNEKAYRSFSFRFIIPICAGALASLFELPLVLCLVLGLAVYIVLEIRFRMYLKSLTMILNFKPEKRLSYIKTAANDNYNKIYMKIALYIALPILLIANAYIEKFDGIALALNYAIAVVGVVFLVLEVRALLFKRSNTNVKSKK